MSPLIVFIGDIFFINLVTRVFLVFLFLFLLYVDKKWPEVITHLYLFILAQFVFTSFHIICFSVTIPVTDSFFDLPFFLNNIFSFSTIALAILMLYAKTKDKRYFYLSGIVISLVFLVQTMTAIMLQ